MEPDGCRRDDAEGTLGANHQRAQVVAGRGLGIEHFLSHKIKAVKTQEVRTIQTMNVHLIWTYCSASSFLYKTMLFFLCQRG